MRPDRFAHKRRPLLMKINSFCAVYDKTRLEIPQQLNSAPITLEAAAMRR